MTDEPVLPYNDDRACPKCESPGRVDRYSGTDDLLRGGEGRFVMSGFTTAHEVLIVRCVACGWEWLTETADAPQRTSR